MTMYLVPPSLKTASFIKNAGENDEINLLGPMFLAGFFLWGLFGIISIQTYIYWQSFTRDRALLKAMVYLLYVLQVAQVLLVTQDKFVRFASQYGNLDNFDTVGTDWISGGIVGGFVAFIVQVYYAWRINIISGKRSPSVIILLLSGVSFVSSVITGLGIRSQGKYRNLGTLPLLIESGFWQGSTAICDVTIAACMVYYLQRSLPQGTQFKGTTRVVNQIIRSSIETGSLTASAAVFTLVAVNAPGNHPYWICSVIVMPGLYTTALLAVLNSRLTSTVTIHSTGHELPEVECSLSRAPVFATHRSTISTIA